MPKNVLASPQVTHVLMLVIGLVAYPIISSVLFSERDVKVPEKDKFAEERGLIQQDPPWLLDRAVQPAEINTALAGLNSPEEQVTFVSRFLESLARKDPSQAASWLLEHKAWANHQDFFSIVAKHLARTDPNEALRWASDLGSIATRNAAMRTALVSILAGESENGITMLSLNSNLPDSVEIFGAVGEAMAASNPDRVAKLVRGDFGDLNDNLRSYLLASLYAAQPSLVSQMIFQQDVSLSGVPGFYAALAEVRPEVAVAFVTSGNIHPDEAFLSELGTQIGKNHYGNMDTLLYGLSPEIRDRVEIAAFRSMAANDQRRAIETAIIQSPGPRRDSMIIEIARQYPELGSSNALVQQIENGEERAKLILQQTAFRIINSPEQATGFLETASISPALKSALLYLADSIDSMPEK